MVQKYPLVFALSWLLAATAEPAATPTQAVQGSDCSGPVLETMDGGGYTYVKVDCDQEQIWAAGPMASIEVGQTLSISKTMPLEQFQSAALDRSFDTIYFVAGFSSRGARGAGNSASAELAEAHRQTEVSSQLIDLSGIERPAGGKTVAEVYAGKNDLAGNEVLVRGRVVKFSANVMGKNWIHLQDGTGEQGKNDVTITTADIVEIGDLILVQGELALDLDLGYGYHYDVIIEGASITIE